MSKDIRHFTKMKEDIEKLKLKKAEAEGAYKQCIQTLKKEFKVNDIKEGEKRLQGQYEEREEIDREIDRIERILEEKFDM